MSPLPEHGKHADVLADLVKALLRNQGKDWEAFTPITLKRIARQGVEPDYCFYIQNRRILGQQRIDLEHDPPPNLVVEIDLTSNTRAEDYQAIGALELWIYRRSQLLIYQFDGQQYQARQTSQQFSSLDIKALIPKCIDKSWQVGSDITLQEFEQFLREGS